MALVERIDLAPHATLTGEEIWQGAGDTSESEQAESGVHFGLFFQIRYP